MSEEMQPRLFGTDGIRGVFGKAPLDRDTVLRLGRQLGNTLQAESGLTKPQVVLGGDTRDSTPTLGGWLREGLLEAGTEVVYLGTVPTPAVALVVCDLGAAAGVAISASHNPYPDNGIKLVRADGFKWDPATEARLEQRLFADRAALPATQRPAPETWQEGVERYRDSLLKSVDGARPLQGLKLAVDCANGAASHLAAHLFSDLGAQVTVRYDQPDGSNINRGCGSTHPEALVDLVQQSGADLGVAFDGDADRALFVDGDGAVRDGDAILFLWARDLSSRGMLPGGAIVATSMSNLGLETALRREGIGVVRCDVGDREVVATLRQRGLVLGGEQSGHIVHLERATTGDGLLTALAVAEIASRNGKDLASLLTGFERFPQLLHNVKVAHKVPLEQLPNVQQARARIESELGTEGRLVLRYSGTESLARIMIEGPDEERIGHMARSLGEVLHQDVAAHVPPQDLASQASTPDP